MKKIIEVVIITIYFIAAVLIAVGSTLNDEKNNTVLTESDGLKRHIWYNGDREEQVFAARDEVAVFTKNVSEKANATALAQSFDPQATLIEDYEFVILGRFPKQLDENALENKIFDFYNTTGNKASFVFYRGPKKDQAPMALTGEIIVKFKPDWDGTKITEWSKSMGLDIIKSFPYSPDTYLFEAGSGLRSLEIANQLYISGQVVYAYPNWWKAMELKDNRTILNYTNISEKNDNISEFPKKIPFIPTIVVMVLIVFIIYICRRK